MLPLLSISMARIFVTSISCSKSIRKFCFYVKVWRESWKFQVERPRLISLESIKKFCFNVKVWRLGILKLSSWKAQDSIICLSTFTFFLDTETIWWDELACLKGPGFLLLEAHYTMEWTGVALLQQNWVIFIFFKISSRFSLIFFRERFKKKT